MVGDIAGLAEVMHHVRRWPLGNRISLAKRILDSFEGPEVDLSPPTRPLRGAFAGAAHEMLRTRATTPIEERCRRSVEEDRFVIDLVGQRFHQ